MLAITSMSPRSPLSVISVRQPPGKVAPQPRNTLLKAAQPEEGAPSGVQPLPRPALKPPGLAGHPLAEQRHPELLAAQDRK